MGPDYVGALVNMHRIKEENCEYIEGRGKAYFGPVTSGDTTYDCRVKRQYMQNNL